MRFRIEQRQQLINEQNEHSEIDATASTKRKAARASDCEQHSKRQEEAGGADRGQHGRKEQYGLRAVSAYQSVNRLIHTCRVLHCSIVQLSLYYTRQ